MSAVPAGDLSDDQKASMAKQIEPQMQALQTALREADDAVKGGAAAIKSMAASVAGPRAAAGADVTAVAGAVVSEISGTLKGVIGLLGLGQFLALGTLCSFPALRA